MASAKDARNYEVKKGDTVSVQLPSANVVGEIDSIRGGGLVTGMRQGGSQVTPGEVIVLVAIRLNFDHTRPMINNMLKLHDDAKAESGPVIKLAN